jgi:hypothetical protein
MTFNQLKEYHLKNLLVILKSEKEVRGIITSHHWNKENTAIAAISLLGKWTIERVECEDIKEIIILEGPD